MADVRSNFPLIILILIIAGLGFFSYDLLFSQPEHQQGTIIDKIFVAAKTVSGATPYGGVKRSNYFVSAQREEQWVALVRMENGDTLQVHCLPEHYRTKKVGDAIHFKQYEGKHFHIKYFAHNEEED